MTSPLYHFWGETRDLATRIYLNGVGLLEGTPDSTKNRAEDISLWIRPGINKLRVGATALPSTHDSAVGLSAMIQQAPRDNLDAAQVLWRIDWPAQGQPPLPPLAQEVQLDCVSPSRLWADATPIAMDVAVEAELRAYAMTLFGLFSSGDYGGLASEMDYKAVDIGRVLEMDATTARGRQAEFLKIIMTRPEFRVAPLQPLAITTTLLADDTVVWLRNGEAPLLLSEARQGMEVYLARIGGRWTVVR